MVAEAVFDASAVLALVNREAGAVTVVEHLAGAVISSVNLAETAGKLVDAGIPPEATRMILMSLGMEVAPFTEDDAYAAAERRASRSRALSLGDRACLALGKTRGLPVVTADRIWADYAGDVDLILIR